MPDSRRAQARAWALLADAHRERPRAARVGRRGRVLALALVTVLVAAAVAVAAQPPRWVRHVLGSTPAPPVRSSLGALPAGRLLVSSAHGTWIVSGDGTRLRLGPWTAATWSPRGPTSPRGAGAVERGGASGRVAWTIAARGPVRDAAWSPDGYRIAYRRDDALAVVAGDGTGARVWPSPCGRWRRRGARARRTRWPGSARPAASRSATSTPARSSGAPRRRRRGERTGLVGRRPSPAGAQRPPPLVLDVTGNRVWRVRLPAGASSARSRGRRGAIGSPWPSHAGSDGHLGHDVGARAPAAGLRHHRHAALARLVAERPAPARALGRGRPMAPALPRRRQRPDHRHRRDLPPLRSAPTVQGWCCA